MYHIRDIFFFFNDTATTEIYTLSLHDALPIWRRPSLALVAGVSVGMLRNGSAQGRRLHGTGTRTARHSQWMPSVVTIDRKSTRLNSSHANISYAVFCLKKKKHNLPVPPPTPAY